MKRHILIDKLQLLDTLGTLNIEDGKVDVHDVIGVINCINSWLTDVRCISITPIISRSEMRRIETQMQDS